MQPPALPSRANSSLTSAAHYRGNSVSVVFLITQEAMLLLLFIIYMIRQARAPYSLLPAGLHSCPHLVTCCLNNSFLLPSPPSEWVRAAGWGGGSRPSPLSPGC